LQETKSKCARTLHFRKFSVVHEQKDKKCRRNTNMLNYLQRFDNSSIFVINTNHLRKFRSDGLTQDKSFREIIKEKEKFK